MKSVNVLVIHQFAIPPDQPGGTRHFALAKNLLKHGITLRIVAETTNYMSKKRSGNIFGDETIQQVNFHWIKTFFSPKNLIFRLASMLEFGIKSFIYGLSLKKRPDLIIGSSPSIFAALSAFMVAKIFKIPFMLEIRDIWPESLVEFSNISKDHFFYRFIELISRFLYVKSDYIISNLAGTGDYLNQKYLVNRVCTWIPNGIDLGPIDVNSVPESHGGQFVISYAGAHGAANNLSVLLEAAALLKDTIIRFHLIGDGPQKESLVAQKELLGLENVIFFDPVNKSEIYSFLQKSDAFIFILQKSDLFKWGLAPNKLFDYMAMRKPILNCVVSPYDPVKKENLGFSVDVCSPDEIASAARKLLRLSTPERQAMGDRALKYVQENHDYEKISEKFRQLICSIVENPEGKSKIEST